MSVMLITRFLGQVPLLLLLCCHYVSAAIPSSGCTLKSPPPASSICGEPGENPLYEHQDFAQQTLNSVTQCQNLCLRRTASGDASCVSFSYDSSSSLCTLSSGALKSISENPASTVVFYERSCFSCPQPCSQQQIGQNVLDNSGFELSSTYLGPWFSSGPGDVAKGGDHSKQSYSCAAGKKGECSIQQSFYTCPNAVYRWSYNYESAVKKFDSFKATASYGGQTSHSLTYSNNKKTLKWQAYSDLFQINNESTAAAMIFNLLPGKATSGKTQSTFLADNIKLEPTNYVVGAEPTAYNSLPGGQFGQGTLAPWKKTVQGENLTIITPGLTPAKYGLKWTIKSGQKNPSFGIVQDISKAKATVPGKAYLFNFDQNNNLPHGHGVHPMFHVQLDIYSGPKASPSIHNSYSNTHIGNSASVRIPFQGQVNQNFVRFTISPITPLLPGEHYYFIVDNISFKPLAKSS